MKKIFLYTLLLGNLLGCNPVVDKTPIALVKIPTSVSTETPVITKSPVPTDWDSRWLAKKPCLAPCWEGITPGITTKNEALNLLQHMSFVDKVTPREPLSKAQTGAIVWKYVSQPDTGGGVRYDVIDQKIVEIAPQYPNKVTFKEIIAAYGLPTHLAATASIPTDAYILCHAIYLIYMENGFLLQTGICSDNFLNISDNLILTGPIIFDKAKFYTHVSIFASGDIRPTKWEGFNDFEYYLAWFKLD